MEKILGSRQQGFAVGEDPPSFWEWGDSDQMRRRTVTKKTTKMVRIGR